MTKLIINVSKYFKCEHNINLWTDAIVLGWLQRKSQTLKTFVANRISNIQSLVNTSQWKHINTNENPADIGSRGCSPQQLQQNQLWWQGPHWLRLPQDQWPPPRSFEPTNIEVKVSQNFTIVSSEDITSRFSTLNRCLRVVSYIFRFVNKCQLKSKQFSKIIEATEIDFVIKRLIMLAQQTYYKREIENLQQGKSINCKSSILTLNPFLAEDGLLRVGRRLSNSNLRYDEKHPILIPVKSHLAYLIVQFSHTILLHSEFQLMLRSIRQVYYIPQLKNLIRKCIRTCKACTIYKHKSQQQIMGSLPKERVQLSLPFTYAGVDFAGPFNL